MATKKKQAKSRKPFGRKPLARVSRVSGDGASAAAIREAVMRSAVPPVVEQSEVVRSAPVVQPMLSEQEVQEKLLEAVKTAVEGVQKQMEQHLPATVGISVVNGKVQLATEFKHRLRRAPVQSPRQKITDGDKTYATYAEWHRAYNLYQHENAKSHNCRLYYERAQNKA